jgi:hypothetical protein
MQFGPSTRTPPARAGGEGTLDLVHAGLAALGEPGGEEVDRTHTLLHALLDQRLDSRARNQ